MAKSEGMPYVARGKKTIDSLAQEARRIGDTNILIVEEREGKAASIASIAVDELGGWKWGETKALEGKEEAAGKRD